MQQPQNNKIKKRNTLINIQNKKMEQKRIHQLLFSAYNTGDFNLLNNISIHFFACVKWRNCVTHYSHHIQFRCFPLSCLLRCNSEQNTHFIDWLAIKIDKFILKFISFDQTPVLPFFSFHLSLSPTHSLSLSHSLPIPLHHPKILAHFF